MSVESHPSMGLRPHCGFWQTSRYRLSLEKPLVMGIVNVTPDSFSAEPATLSVSHAIHLAERLKLEGADILDIGGESTRPGAVALTHEQEWQRIQPVIQELVRWNVPISVDTYHPQTMQRALDAGVDIINDIWALRQPGALQVVAAYPCGVCLMHMHGEPSTMQLTPMTGDPVVQVNEFFKQRLSIVAEGNISSDRLVLDPGIGFGKSVEQNFALLQRQHELLRLQLPLLVGWSRKSSLGAVTGLGVNDRLVPSIAAAVLAFERGATVVRVHDVADTVAALAVWQSAHLREVKFG
jgi:dihydropteroate synthase